MLTSKISGHIMSYCLTDSGVKNAASKNVGMRHLGVNWSRPLLYLSPDALVLFCLQEVEQHLQKGGVLAVRLHHVTCAGHLLAQRPQRHLVDCKWKIILGKNHFAVYICLDCVLSNQLCS